MGDKFAGKPFDIWIAILVGVLIAIERHKEKSVASRAFIAAISAGLSYTQSDALAAWSNINVVIVHTFLGGFGYFIIDIITGILSDREFFKDLIVSRIPGGSTKRRDRGE